MHFSPIFLLGAEPADLRTHTASVSSLTVLAQISSLLQIKPGCVFSVVKFEVRLFSELFPLFQLLALATV